VRTTRRALALGAFLLAVGQLVALPSARADRVQEAWRRGNEAYLHGDYAAAVAAYEEVDRQGPASSDLAFNLGDAYFRKGAIGPAIWAYERALALDPGDEDARYNLDKARKLAARRAHDRMEGEDKDPAWMRFVGGLAPSMVTWSFVALYVLFFAALVARRRARSETRPALTAAAAALAAGALLAGALLAGRVHLDRIPFGVVLPDEVAVKEGADVNYRTSFEAHAGLRVRVVDRDQDWVRVRLANGLEGWVRAQEIGRI
jgi:tetratricopeptide (TPR) repeat protein